MAASHERGSISTMPFEAKYTVFQYFLVVNSVATIYGFLVLFIPKESLLWQPMVPVDLVHVLKPNFNHGTHLKLLCSIAIAMVGPRGNSYWKPICGSIPNYCDKVTGAFAADLIAVVIYVKLLQLI
ncbi:CASP-like protein 1C1 [Glycine soja]